LIQYIRFTIYRKEVAKIVFSWNFFRLKNPANPGICTFFEITPAAIFAGASAVPAIIIFV
jgi:hypothetical protein